MSTDALDGAAAGGALEELTAHELAERYWYAVLTGISPRGPARGSFRAECRRRMAEHCCTQEPPICYPIVTKRGIEMLQNLY